MNWCYCYKKKKRFLYATEYFRDVIKVEYCIFINFTINNVKQHSIEYFLKITVQRKSNTDLSNLGGNSLAKKGCWRIQHCRNKLNHQTSSWIFFIIIFFAKYIDSAVIHCCKALGYDRSHQSDSTDYEATAKCKRSGTSLWGVSIAGFTRRLIKLKQASGGHLLSLPLPQGRIKNTQIIPDKSPPPAGGFTTSLGNPRQCSGRPSYQDRFVGGKGGDI